jgi:hypothetical protein
VVTVDSDDGDMGMPGAYVMDEEEITTAGMRPRRSRRILSSSSATNKPASKSKAKKHISSGSATGVSGMVGRRVRSSLLESRLLLEKMRRMKRPRQPLLLGRKSHRWEG